MRPTNFEFNGQLFDTARRSLAIHSQKFVPQDQSLLDLVVGAGGNPTDYLYGGLTVSLGIRAVLLYLGTPITSFERILDLGCGTARVLRWFADVVPDTKLYGADIHSKSVEWCVENIPFAQFVRNDPMPPLPFPGSTFDLVLALSVLTHLNEEMQLAWLQELHRITKHGAFVLLSVHGEDKAAGGLWANEYLQFLNRGFFYKAARQRPTVQNLPIFTRSLSTQESTSTAHGRGSSIFGHTSDMDHSTRRNWWYCRRQTNSQAPLFRTRLSICPLPSWTIRSLDHSWMSFIWT